MADDESLWANQQEKGLLKAEYLAEYVLRLWFEEELDVSIYELDFQPLLVDENPGGVFEMLKASARNCRSRVSVIPKVRKRLKSTLTTPGPCRMFRPEVPQRSPPSDEEVVTFSKAEVSKNGVVTSPTPPR